ncbi:LysR family transcriptional regulator [Alphaproteobacteria bacterium GH1-50]|uniref:LysR family transcriptional regulator n=1 Tax=Kangsaoukella pontilimi TaxID=2691042 RepID=A0A7C9IQX3_9RHOB|nr:LysR family transcriptional regulator [Kangsaoukella pontilimi]MXQ06786.1 LysR family transcriptional regulator [Kangsaoukella pontilimi]
MPAEPDWNDFRVILALGRAGSVAGAAHLLKVDPSTVSRRLAAAETAFRAVLVVREARAFSLTREGKSAFAAAEAMEAVADRARAEIRDARGSLEGVVRIACPPVAVRYLEDFPGAVASEHPGIGVELLSGRAPVNLAKGEADISIRAVRQADMDLAVAHSFGLGSGVFAAESYIEAQGRPSTPEDIAAHALVRYAEAFLHMPPFAWIEQFARPGKPGIRVDNIDMAQHRIASGSGIGVLYCIAGDADDRLVRLFEEPIDVTDMNIVYHQSMRGSARLRAVLDLLVAFHIERRATLVGRKS